MEAFQARGLQSGGNGGESTPIWVKDFSMRTDDMGLMAKCRGLIGRGGRARHKENGLSISCDDAGKKGPKKKPMIYEGDRRGKGRGSPFSQKHGPEKCGKKDKCIGGRQRENGAIRKQKNSKRLPREKRHLRKGHLHRRSKLSNRVFRVDFLT